MHIDAACNQRSRRRRSEDEKADESERCASRPGAGDADADALLPPHRLED